MFTECRRHEWGRPPLVRRVWGISPEKIFKFKMSVEVFLRPFLLVKLGLLYRHYMTLYSYLFRTPPPKYRRLSAIMFYLPFLNFLSVMYRWNRNKMFYLLSSSDVAYLDCVDIYKAFNFAASPKIECYNVLSPF